MVSDRPAAEGVSAGHFVGPPVAAGHIAPCPRRIRGFEQGRLLLDVTDAFYVWEHPYYPQYAFRAERLPATLRDRARPLPESASLDGYVIVALDASIDWFEEDEQILGHPRSPYVRVDTLRSHRSVSVTLDREGAEPLVLANSSDCVAVFETGLPPRWYLDPTTVDFSLLSPSSTSSRCPYKGLADRWWSVGDLTDVAWSYPAPTPAAQPIAGLVCFDDSLVHVAVSD